MNPLSTIYGAAVQAKNRFYDRRILQPKTLAGPVVSVGNISVGGSGKTPFVILLGEELKSRGIGCDVLSRGYGRKSRGVRLVDPKGSAEEFGDEPLLIARRVGCPVIVGESRFEAGQFAESKFGPQLHLLDDGFQHRSLARNLDIVLLTKDDLDDRLLPAGRLREPLSSLRRADEIIATGDFELPARKLRRVKRTISVENAPPRPVVFCGIARPKAFVEQLRDIGVNPAAQRFYRDHHSYKSDDIRELHKLRERHGADGFLTTEKDVVNLGALATELDTLAVTRVVLRFESPDDLDALLQYISSLQERGVREFQQP